MVLLKAALKEAAKPDSRILRLQMVLLKAVSKEASHLASSHHDILKLEVVPPVVATDAAAEIRPETAMAGDPVPKSALQDCPLISPNIILTKGLS